jgi:hypothetical protein
MYSKPRTIKGQFKQFIGKIFHPVKRIELDKYEQDWIAFCKFHFLNIRNEPFLDQIKFMYERHYALDTNTYPGYEHVVMEKLFHIYMKIRGNSYSNDTDILNVLNAAIFDIPHLNGLVPETYSPVQRVILKLHGLIANTSVLDKYGRTIITFKKMTDQ